MRLGNKTVYTLDVMGNRKAETASMRPMRCIATHTRVINALNQLYRT